MSEKSFDASRYLRKLNGKDYLEVKWRLLWLRTEHPEAVISTELVKHEAGLALFRARVSLPESGEATGWGSETSSDFLDYIETAETKALGGPWPPWATARSSARTSTSRPRLPQQDPAPVVDAPVAAPAGGARTREARATAPQVKAIYSIARSRRGLGEAEVEERSRAAYGRPPAELSRRQASQFIDALKKQG